MRGGKTRDVVREAAGKNSPATYLQVTGPEWIATQEETGSVYFWLRANLRFAAPANPSMEVPTKTKVLGSGTVESLGGRTCE